MRRLGLLGALAASALLLAPALSGADSFNPITLQVRARSHARARKHMKIRVAVAADPGVLDARSGAIRVRVKLARSLCGATFESTVGRVLINKRLRPQPHAGRAYSASIKGRRKPRLVGTHPLCVFLTDDYKVFASDTTDYTVTVRR